MGSVLGFAVVDGFDVAVTFNLIGTLFAVSTVLAVVGWIGWRFFLHPVSSPVAVVSSSKRPQVATISAKTGQGNSKRGMVVRIGTTLGVVVLVGAIVSGGVFLISDQIIPEPLAALALDRQTHIRGMFNPERLVPPPPLPPSMFIGSGRPEMETADRDWSRLEPEFTQAVLVVMSRLDARGYPFALLEGYRSPERQERLAALGNHVTSARAYQSKHQYGMAADIAPVKDGRLIISERDPWAMAAYVALGEEAERVGLTWGGKWWFKDYGHVEVAGAIGKVRGDKSSASSGNVGGSVSMAKTETLESSK